MIQQVADDLVGTFLSRGSTELISEFARPLPISAISEIIGVLPQDRLAFKGWVTDIWARRRLVTSCSAR